MRECKHDFYGVTLAGVIKRKKIMIILRKYNKVRD